jgi:hypothetical protein
MKRLKFFLGIVMIILVGAFLPTIIQKFGMLTSMSDKSWVVILVAGFGLLFKSLIGDMVSGDFTFHKFGFDNCILTFGGVLTACVLQLKSTIDCYPELSLSLLGKFDKTGGDIVNSRKIELAILLLLSLLFVLFTANNSKMIKKDETTCKKTLSLLNAGAGTLALMTYLYILILKG